MKTVKEVAELSGVTVRTLHHYDEIGLLKPSERSEAGYRLYSHADLKRLQEILGWRELGFALTEIRSLVDDPGYDRPSALRRQRELAEAEAERLAALRAALDAAIAAETTGKEQDVKTMFDGFDPQEYQEEARDRWGGTPEYEESIRRTRSYGEQEWRAIREEGDAIAAGVAALVGGGPGPPRGEAARAGPPHPP